MRKRLGLAALVLAAFAGAVGMGLAKTPNAATSSGGPAVPLKRAPAAGKFVVHEWGTFTSFSGADGVRLEFRPLVDDELPGFVYNRVTQGAGWDLLGSKIDISALERMETPVTYFYVDEPREVAAKVAFPQGLLTEFYPPVQTMLPPFQRNKRPEIANSSLDWGKIRLLPPREFARLRRQREEDRVASLLPAVNLPGFSEGKDQSVAKLPPLDLPAVAGDNHYAFARETDSAIVEVVDQYLQKHYEKFLFYRGLGDFPLPLSFSATEPGRFTVKNEGPDAVRDLFLVQIDGSRVRFRHAAQVAAYGELTIETPESYSTIDELGEEMVQALIVTGLYEKEARAMVKTWRSSWFGENGTRLLYLVPERITDELLPLAIEPKPDEQLRVLVGRMELLPPEECERLLALVGETGSCLSIEAEPLRSELVRLGRFAEPALKYLARSAKDERQRATIEQLTADLGTTMR
ncbi:MAG TPA: hypothetical protein VHB99_18330, partial [Pirellulales bacterium]|nr:hypothetical protein [Pirellulales bacterium]